MEESKDYEGSQYEEEEVQEDPDELGKALIKASANGDYASVISLLKRKADPNYLDKKQWNPLMWASSQGSTDIVSVLLESGATIHQPQQSEEEESIGSTSPLHWASFNGHIQTVWLLMRKGFSPLDLDKFGNNCIHQAVAGGRSDILETFLAFGVSAEHKNSRGHMPIHLTSDLHLKEMINLAVKAKKCKKCSSIFDIHNNRYLCQVCKKYYCANCKVSTWLYLTNDSKEEERPVCRCTDCHNQIEQKELELNDAIDSNIFDQVDRVSKEIENGKFDIDVKLLHKAKVEHERLRTEGEIQKFLGSLSYVENYKTIQKSVYLIGQMLEDAANRGVAVDQRIIDKAKAESDRLMAERNLRHQTAITSLANATDEAVLILETLNKTAEANNVAMEYRDRAADLINRMKENIHAHQILRTFLDYPMREYPEPVVQDPRKRAPIKKVEEKKEPPKKKKKEPKFNIPEWAAQLPALIAQVNALDALVKQAQNLELGDDFLNQAKENMIRMRKEIRFRQQEEEEARIAAEKRKAEAKKNKK